MRKELQENSLQNKSGYNLVMTAYRP